LARFSALIVNVASVSNGDDANLPDLFTDFVDYTIVANAIAIAVCQIALERLDVGVKSRILFKLAETSDDFLGKHSISSDKEGFGLS